MTARRLWVLVSNLPGESAFGVALRHAADSRTPVVESLPMIGPDGRVRPPTDLTAIPVAADMRAARDLISGAGATQA